MEVVTLLIAVFGAVTGAASLGWSIASHVLSGGRVHVELRGGWVGSSNLVTAPLTRNPIRPDPTWFDEPVLAVQASNVGRLPVSVVGWQVKIGEAGLGHVSHHANPELPKLLGVGEQATWIIPLDAILRAANASSAAGLKVQALQASVSLGSGLVRKSKVAPVRTSELAAIFNG